jgi:SAM-dependent methyltransferase
MPALINQRLTALYNRILGHPFVYDRVRPFVVGGIDLSPLYQSLESGPDDVILDVGCGTGIAHEYLKGFRTYHGFDTDPVAIEAATAKTAAANVHYDCRLLTPEDVTRIRPTRVILAGILHHLSDDEALALLRMCGSSSSDVRIVTADPTYLPGQWVSNTFAFFDRGRFVRKPPGYKGLAERAGLRIVRDEIIRLHPTKGRVLFLMMRLEPG